MSERGPTKRVGVALRFEAFVRVIKVKVRDMLGASVRVRFESRPM